MGLTGSPWSIGDDLGDDPKLSEAGSPHARNGVLLIERREVTADTVAIMYDWKAAAARVDRGARI